MRRILLLAVLLFVSGAAASLARVTQSQEKPEEAKIPPEEAKRENPFKPSPERLAAARRIYRFDCAMCHGAEGDGKSDLADQMKLTLKNWRDPAALAGMTDGELFYVINKGRGKMVGEGDRQKDEMLWNLVNLVRSFAKKEPGGTPKPENPKQ